MITPGAWTFERDPTDESVGMVYGPNEFLIALVAIKKGDEDVGLSNGNAIAYLPNLFEDFSRVRDERNKLADILLAERKGG